LTALVAVLCGLVGVPVGLFLNVVIERVPEKQPLREGLPPGRPRAAVEWWVVAGTAALFAALGVRFGADWALPAYLVLAASLLSIAVIDLRLYIVPNRIVYPTLALSIPLLVGVALLHHQEEEPRPDRADGGGADGCGVVVQEGGTNEERDRQRQRRVHDAVRHDVEAQVDHRDRQQ